MTMARTPPTATGRVPRPCTISNRPRDSTQRCRNNTHATMAMDTLASVLCITGLAPTSETKLW